MFPWSHPNWPAARAKGPLIKDTDSGTRRIAADGPRLARKPAALYPLSCNGESLRRSLLAALLSRPRLVRTHGSGSVAVSDRAHTAPGSLPEIVAPTLPDHRFSIYGWMLSMMITWAGYFSK